MDPASCKYPTELLSLCLQEAVTFLILLLYSPPFKYGFGAVLVPFYGDMATKPKSHPITKAMDRLTVQIFNSEVCGWLGGWAL